MVRLRASHKATGHGGSITLGSYQVGVIWYRQIYLHIEGSHRRVYQTELTNWAPNHFLRHEVKSATFPDLRDYINQKRQLSGDHPKASISRGMNYELQFWRKKTIVSEPNFSIPVIGEFSWIFQWNRKSNEKALKCLGGAFWREWFLIWQDI